MAAAAHYSAAPACDSAVKREGAGWLGVVVVPQGSLELSEESLALVDSLAVNQL